MSPHVREPKGLPGRESLDLETDLRPGRTYLLVFDDCCVKGEISARFVRYERYGNDAHPEDVGEIERLVFDHLTLQNWSRVVAHDRT